MPDSPFIDRDSGTVVSKYGIHPPTTGSLTTFFGIEQSALKIGSCTWYGSTPVSISAVATSSNTLSFNRYGGPSIDVTFDSPATLQDVKIPGLVAESSGIGDPIEDSNALPVVFKAKGAGFKTGDQWLFQILPATISPARPNKRGLAYISATGVFINEGPLTLEIEVTELVSCPLSSSGERSMQVTLKSSWYKDPDPASHSTEPTLVYSGSKDFVVGAKDTSVSVLNSDPYIFSSLC